MMGTHRGKSMMNRKEHHGEKDTGAFDDQPPSRCVSVSSATELQDLLQPREDGGITEVSLCSTEVKFERTVQLPRFAIIQCPMNNKCIFDGQNERRLFVYTINTTQVPEEQYASMIFDNIVFQNGNGEGGGAIKLVGESTASRAMFRDCAFLYNNGSYSHNGGAIDAAPWYALDAVDTTFVGNAAHTGGAIHSLDARIFLRNTSFANNTACGAGEGPAIYVSSTSWTERIGTVRCDGTDNVFESNLDGSCIEGDYDDLNPLDIVAPNVLGCDDTPPAD